jgi:hypothetical protein
MRTNSRGCPGSMRPALNGAQELPFHAQGWIFCDGADQRPNRSSYGPCAPWHRNPLQPADVDHGQLVGRRLKDVSVVENLDELGDGGPGAHAPASATGFNCTSASRGLRCAALDSSFQLRWSRKLSAITGYGSGLIAIREIVGPQDRAAADVHLPG